MFCTSSRFHLQESNEKLVPVFGPGYTGLKNLGNRYVCVCVRACVRVRMCACACVRACVRVQVQVAVGQSDL